MSRRFVVPPDTRELQKKAAQPGVSAWVSANAGSGKTHVLAQRVIRLLLDGADPSRILCLTYTKAAAANMASRVFSNLGRWATLPEEMLAAEIMELDGTEPRPARIATARQLFARALETPGGLKIQTIHAFCEAVLHQFPLEANIAGHFEMLDSAMEAALLAEARREMIVRAATGESAGLAEAFARVLDLGGESGLDGLLDAIVGQRDALRRFIVELDDGNGRFPALLAEFGITETETADSIAAGVLPDRYFDRSLARAMAARADAAGKAMAAGFARDLEAALAETAPTARLQALRRRFLTRKAGGVWEPKTTKQILAKGVGEHFPDFDDEFQRFAARIEAVADRVALRTMLDATHAALVLADWLIARYGRLKAARGFLDFNDLITRTANLLVRQDAGAWVRFKLDKGVDHILLDEAQDTSPAQWAVVKALAAEFFVGRGQHEGRDRTVFAVGDEKQSIYSFQGADPESFAISGREFRDQVMAVDGRFERVELKRSFRSTEDVLAAVDLVFSQPENRKGLTRDDEPIAHTAIRVGVPGHVELWPSLGPVNVEEPDDWSRAIDHASAPAVRLAAQIAQTIEHWLASKEVIEGIGRPLRAGDVMVLVRKRDSFIHALGRELKNRGVPVAGADRLMLTAHIAVKDLMAIARVALQPQDDLSLAALLKSPAFGFDDDDLLALAGERGTRSLWASLAVVADPRARAAHERLSAWRNEAGYLSPFEFFSGALARDGLRRRFIARLGPEAGDIVDEFLSFCLAAEKAGIMGIEALLALLDAGGPEIKREMDQTRGEVRILTAHAAKGLEAPVVFLVDSGSAAFSDSHLPRLVPFDAPAKGWRGKGFLWRAGVEMGNTFSRRLAAEVRVRAEQEYRRLLYVGMTRAEDRLIVCGYHGKRGPSDGAWHALVRDALAPSPAASEVIHPVTGEAILRYAVTSPGAVPPQDEPVPAVVSPGPLPVALTMPLPPAPKLPRPLVPSGASAIVEPETALPGTRSPVLDADDAPGLAIERGTAVHRLLQVLPALAPEAREPAALRYLGAIGRAWPEGEAARVWRSVERVLDDPGMAPLFGARSRAEVSIMGRVTVAGADHAVAGKIDRLSIDEGGVLIVDFKTGRPVPLEPGEVPASHVAQMALYRALVAPLHPGLPVRAALVYTEGPLLVPLSETVLDAALARLTGA